MKDGIEWLQRGTILLNKNEEVSFALQLELEFSNVAHELAAQSNMIHELAAQSNMIHELAEHSKMIHELVKHSEDS